MADQARLVEKIASDVMAKYLLSIDYYLILSSLALAPDVNQRYLAETCQISKILAQIWHKTA